MKIFRRILFILLALVILLVAAAIAIPYFYKDQLMAFAKQEINANVNAKVDFQDVNISLFRNFPNLSVGLKGFSMSGKGIFEGIPLASADNVRATVNLSSLLGNSPLQIEGVFVESPKINILVLEDGKANFDITLPDTSAAPTPETAEQADFLIQLKKYGIENGNVVYDDRQTGTYAAVEGLNHRGSGDFTLSQFDLNTLTEIQSMTVKYGGITYFDHAKANLDAAFLIDQAQSKYSFKDNNLTLNALKLNFEGFVQLLGDDIAMDLALKTPQNDFKSLFSLIPNAFIEGYEAVKADGQFNLSGGAKGTYSAQKNQLPSFWVDLGVQNGSVKYPDLPLGISNIQTKVSVNSPTSDMDDLIVEVPNFNVNIGNNPVAGVFSLKTPISDPDVNGKINGKINLADISKAMPMPGVDLQGSISADVRARARLSQIEAQQYESIDMSGQVSAQNLVYASKDLPKVTIREAQAQFSPQKVSISKFVSQLGKSDLSASGSIDNILAYFSPQKTMKGDFNIQSNLFDANEWVSATTTPVPDAGAVALENEPAATPTEIFDRFEFNVDAGIGKLLYDTYEVNNIRTKGYLAPNKLKIDDAAAQIGRSDLAVTGVIENVFDYLFKKETLRGDIAIKSKLLDLNEFMATTSPAAGASSSTTSSAPMEAFKVPERMDINIDANVGRVLYTNMTLDNVQGNLIVANEAVVLDDVLANTLGGKIAMSGGYDSKDKEEPEFSIKYDFQDMDFQKTFAAFNTFQKLAPIGEFIKGVFNTSLIMEGRLGKDLMPDLNSLSAQGFLETINGAINNFKPLQAVGNALNVAELKEGLRLENTRNWFEIANGAVVVKEFDYQVKDIAMKIGGKHSISNEMDYQIKAAIPRELLEKNAVGAAAGTGFNFLKGEAAKLGINIQEGEMVNVQVNLAGTIKDPKVSVKLLGMDGQTTLKETATAAVKEEIEQQKEELRAKAEEKVEQGKQVVKEEADKLIDSAKNVAGQKLEEVKEDIKAKAGEKIGGVIDSVAGQKGKQVLDSLGVDDIKSKLDKFNPFKKKKN